MVLTLIEQLLIASGTIELRRKQTPLEVCHSGDTNIEVLFDKWKTIPPDSSDQVV